MIVESDVVGCIVVVDGLYFEDFGVCLCLVSYIYDIEGDFFFVIDVRGGVMCYCSDWYLVVEEYCCGGFVFMFCWDDVVCGWDVWVVEIWGIDDFYCCSFDYLL